MRSTLKSDSPRAFSFLHRRPGRAAASRLTKRGLRLEPLERRVLLAADLAFSKVGLVDSTVAGLPDRIDAGDTIAYEFSVENIGDEALTNVSVSDPRPGLGDMSPAVVETLAPGETAVFSATYTVTQADLDAGELSNTATAVADGDISMTATSTVNLEQVGELLVDKFLAENNDADSSGDISVGDELTFGIAVANTGNVTLSDIDVHDVIVREGDDDALVVVPLLNDQGTPDDATDDVNIGDANANGLLDVGETWSYEALYTVAENDAAEGQVFLQNVAVATAVTPLGETVKAADGLVLASGEGVGSPGYWKNHPEVWMDANQDGVIDDQDVLVIGDWDGDGAPDDQGFTLTTTEALRILDASQTQKGGDKRFTLGRSVIASWLNITVAGNNYDVGDINVGEKIDEAAAWLMAFDADSDGNPFNDSVKKKDLNQAWGEEGEALYEFLDEYNNTGLGIAIDRDTGEGVIDPAVVDEVLQNF